MTHHKSSHHKKREVLDSQTRLRLRLKQTSVHQKHACKAKNPATSRVLGLIEA